jgi:hypothetical protein
VDGACEFSAIDVEQDGAWRVDLSRLQRLEGRELQGEAVLVFSRDEDDNGDIFLWTRQGASRRATVAAAFRSAQLSRLARGENAVEQQGGAADVMGSSSETLSTPPFLTLP